MANAGLFAVSCRPIIVIGTSSAADCTGKRMIEQRINEFFGDAESTGFGTGWWSGILSVFFGFLACGGVLCLHLPQFLTSAEFRPFYSLHAIRLLIQVLIVSAVLFGAFSAIRRKKRVLAF